MSFDIIHDAEKDISALIDPELGRALGPIALGEDGVNLLEKFAGAHGVDPTKIPTALIESRWEDFVKALSDVQDAVEGKPDEGAVEDPALPAAAADTAAASEPEPAATEAAASPEAEAGPTEATSPSPVVGADAAAPSDDDTPTPVVTPREGYVICPTCDGWRTIASGEAEVQCPTCKGTGEILGEQPEPDLASKEVKD